MTSTSSNPQHSFRFPRSLERHLGEPEVAEADTVGSFSFPFVDIYLGRCSQSNANLLCQMVDVAKD